MTGPTGTALASRAAGRRWPVFTTFVDCLTLEETVCEVERLVEAGGPHQHVVLNAAKIVMMDRREDLNTIVSGCSIINADGMSVVWGARLLGVPVPERVAGIDLFTRLVGSCAERGWKPYFLGARPEVVRSVVAGFRALHPDLRVAGHRSGYWDPDDDADVVSAVAASGAHMLFMAVPSPRKEYWLARHLEDLGVPFVMGVGGAFDVCAGVTRRAPAWMQRAGLEWAYRLGQEPRRMARRYLAGNLRFAMLLARWWRRGRRARQLLR
jgi:N-acetylglucosaminyldiphosphoundecaprenol N-acetyl-beta-D-mannosaminyltransferase